MRLPMLHNGPAIACGPGLFLLAFAASACASEEPAPTSPEAVEFFEGNVRPLLAGQCYSCHGAKNHKGGLRLDSRSALLNGGDRGPAFVPGQPENSLLVQAINYASDDVKMPPSRKLSKEQIADLTRWVQMGAPWPGVDEPSVEASIRGKEITDQDRAHWAFQPVRRASVPAVKDSKWSANPIDAFILAELEAKELLPSAPATKQALVRRAYYDLTGLPPTPAEVEAFLADHSPCAYEALIDRLLDSPRYGEKWGRHWLDLVRFAETNSYERDNAKPNAWRYRDYVIRSFNQDKPYDRFIREQLAGDELPDGGFDGIIATGYYRLGIWNDEPTDRDQARYDGLDDIVATTGQVFLGLTLDCARCHDHKLDPVPQRDYYKILAFFNNVHDFRNGGQTDEKPVISSDPEAAYEEGIRLLDRNRRMIQEALTGFENEFRALYQQAHGRQVADEEIDKRVDEEGAKLLGEDRYKGYRGLRKSHEALSSQAAVMKLKPPGELALCVTEKGGRASDTFVMLRGNAHVRGDKVEPGFPEVLGAASPAIPEPPPGARTCGRRRALADWIASKDNPLTTRVMVNRIWQHHFGRGIVRSPNNFGLQGDKPTHPELLDWLADEFVRQGWRLKPLHRLMMTSNAYRMSSAMAMNPHSADPTNDLFWRFDMRRLTAEEIRDSLLSVGGTLNLKMYGPGIYVEIPKEVHAGQLIPGYGWGKSPPEEQARRSVYIHVKRSLLTPILETFDTAETDRSTSVRFTTTQPTQSLAMLNSAFMGEQAALLAARLKKEAGDDTARQVERALFLTTQRKPAAQEVRRGVELIETLRAKDGASADVAVKYFCLMVLNLNEMLYLD